MTKLGLILIVVWVIAVIKVMDNAYSKSVCESVA